MVIFKTSRQLRLVSAYLNQILQRPNFDWLRLSMCGLPVPAMHPEGT
jgi:hypothetical protein